MKKVIRLFINKINKLFLSFERKANNKRYIEILNTIKTKKQVEIIFLVSHPSQWKYKTLYDLFEQSLIYNPTVAVINEETYEANEGFEQIQETFSYFEKFGYRVIYGFDLKTKNHVNIEENLNPDIVFYSRAINDKQYFRIRYFKNSLACYVPYSFFVDKNDYLQLATPFHQKLWRYYVPTKYAYISAKKQFPSENIKVVGYPGCDPFLKNQENQENKIWKSENKKRIIWAPHHTIEEGSDWPYFSTFLNYAHDFFKYVQINNHIVEVCFKPHPGLKYKLYKHPLWGKQKTDNYFNEWKYLNNGSLSEGGYEELFITSYAMILDSVSFTAEYLYLNKPYCFLTRKDKGDYTRFLNSAGQIIFSNIYKSSDFKGIESFINDVVLEGNDYLALQRANCFKEKLKININASQQIYDDINNLIKGVK